MHKSKVARTSLLTGT